MIAAVDRRAAIALPADDIQHAVIIDRLIDKPRLTPARIHTGDADRMQVVFIDVDLPVENVGEISEVVDDLAGATGVQIIVIAEESGMAVVGNVQVIPVLRPEDVVANLDLLRCSGHADVVPRRRVESVVKDANIRAPHHRDAGGIAID